MTLYKFLKIQTIALLQHTRQLQEVLQKRLELRPVGTVDEANECEEAASRQVQRPDHEAGTTSRRDRSRRPKTYDERQRPGASGRLRSLSGEPRL
jgi:hypothetical protein